MSQTAQNDHCPQRLMEQISASVQQLARELHGALSIGDRDWHRLKSDRHHRAAEQLAAALQILLLQGAEGDQAVLELLQSAERGDQYR